MTKTKLTFEEGVRLAHSRLVADINNRIVIAKMGGHESADWGIDLKRFLSTPEQIITEGERNATASK